MEDICSEGGEGSGNRMNQVVRTVSKLADSRDLCGRGGRRNLRGIRSRGLRQSLLYGGSRAAIGNNYRGIMQLPGEECRTEAERNVSET